MKRPSLLKHAYDADSVMTPMIDVVFLLLVFFVWTASFKVVEYILPTTMSAQLGAESEQVTETPPELLDFEQVVVRLEPAQGSAGAGGAQVFLNDQPLVSLAELGSRLATIFAVSSEAPVIVYPDPQVRMDAIIEVYDLARSTGFEKVNFAVNAQ